MIGIVGGMGPWATADLLDKIAQETRASVDQEHVPVLVISASDRIPDRTAFMEAHSRGEETQNPGLQVADQAHHLIRCGATVIGMPCNTVHFPAIFAQVEKRVADTALVSIVKETVDALSKGLRPGSRVGVLGTLATLKYRLYDDVLAEAGFEVVRPSARSIEQIHWNALYGKEGIKRTPGLVSEAALDVVESVCAELIDGGAEWVLLACTELPIVLRHFDGERRERLPLLDPTRFLARGLVRSYDPEKLREEHWPSI